MIHMYMYPYLATPAMWATWFEYIEYLQVRSLGISLRTLFVIDKCVLPNKGHTYSMNMIITTMHKYYV